MSEEFLTVGEIAELLKVNQQTVRNWIDRGSLPAVRVGRRVRVRQSALDRILGTGSDDAGTGGRRDEVAPTSGPEPEGPEAVLARNRFAATLAETIRIATGPEAGHLSASLRALATAAQNLATALDPEHGRHSAGGKGSAPGPGVAREAVTHRVTAKDIEAGQVRIPPATKELFPTGRAELQVRIRGMMLAGNWDPRVGPERPRAGLLRFGRGRLELLIGENDVLSVSLDDAGMFEFT